MPKQTIILTLGMEGAGDPTDCIDEPGGQATGTLELLPCCATSPGATLGT